jgi:hypothetical protein
MALATDERYTPKPWIDRVVQALGHIDLDPTADEAESIPARHHITVEQDCLTTPWMQFLPSCGTAFMNPPYSDSKPFLDRWAFYLEAGILLEGITLTLSGVIHNKRTQPIVAKYAKAVAFPFGRINFDNGGKSNDRDVCFILWGDTSDGIERFRDAFKDSCLIAVFDN